MTGLLVLNHTRTETVHVAATAPVRRLIERMQAAGWKVVASAPYRGAVEVYYDNCIPSTHPRTPAVFGWLRIGARTGRFITGGAEQTWGPQAATHSWGKLADARAFVNRHTEGN